MSGWSEIGVSSTALRGVQGQLVFVRVHVSPRSLEELLEVLAQLDFPINPEIRHGHPDTVVEFPAYETHLQEIRKVIENRRLEEVRLELANMLGAIG